VPVARVDRCRVNPYQQLVVGGHRHVDVCELEHVRGTVPVLDYRFHEISESKDRMGEEGCPASALRLLHRKSYVVR
jgi:hypothetical protein